MPFGRRLAPLTFALLGACHGGSSSPDELPDPDVAPHAANPAGVPYPAAPSSARTGDVAPNLTFEGYPDSNRAPGLVTVSFADLYDPTGKDHSVIFVSIAANWCARCVEEIPDMLSLAPSYRSKGVVMLQVLVAGSTSGYGPSQADLDAWVGGQHSAWTVVADVRSRRMTSALGLAGVPSSMLIDARTMTIIHESAGAPDDLEAYLKEGLDWVAQHPL
jgi:hypothetical protein